MVVGCLHLSSGLESGVFSLMSGRIKHALVNPKTGPLFTYWIIWICAYVNLNCHVWPNEGSFLVFRFGYFLIGFRHNLSLTLIGNNILHDRGVIRRITHVNLRFSLEYNNNNNTKKWTVRMALVSLH